MNEKPQPPAVSLQVQKLLEEATREAEQRAQMRLKRALDPVRGPAGVIMAKPQSFLSRSIARLRGR